MNTQLASMEAQRNQLQKEREALAAHFPGLSVEEVAELARGLDAKIRAHLEENLEELIELRRALKEAFPGVTPAEALKMVAFAAGPGAAAVEATIEQEVRTLSEEKALLAATFEDADPDSIAEAIRRKTALLEALEQAA